MTLMLVPPCIPSSPFSTHKVTEYYELIESFYSLWWIRYYYYKSAVGEKVCECLPLVLIRRQCLERRNSVWTITIIFCKAGLLVQLLQGWSNTNQILGYLRAALVTSISVTQSRWYATKNTDLIESIFVICTTEPNFTVMWSYYLPAYHVHNWLCE